MSHFSKIFLLLISIVANQANGSDECPHYFLPKDVVKLMMKTVITLSHGELAAAFSYGRCNKFTYKAYKEIISEKIRSAQNLFYFIVNNSDNPEIVQDGSINYVNWKRPDGTSQVELVGGEAIQLRDNTNQGFQKYFPPLTISEPQTMKDVFEFEEIVLPYLLSKLIETTAELDCVDPMKSIRRIPGKKLIILSEILNYANIKILKSKIPTYRQRVESTDGYTCIRYLLTENFHDLILNEISSFSYFNFMGFFIYKLDEATQEFFLRFVDRIHIKKYNVAND